MTKSRKPYGYWSKEKNIKKELKSIIDHYGYFLNVEELREKGHLSLISAIASTGGIAKYRSFFNFKNPKKPQGYWNEKDNIENEVREVVKTLGRYPAYKDLITLNRGDLAKAIIRLYGNIQKLAVHMGYEPPKRKPRGYWKDINNIKSEIGELEKKLGHYPTYTELEKNGKVVLLDRIEKYHGGYIKFLEKVGRKSLKKAKGFWKDWNNVKSELTNVNNKIGHFPTQKEMADISPSLHGAITKYHGGISNVKRKLGYTDFRINKNDNYWNDINNLKKELLEVIEKIGHYPTKNDLEKLGKKYLTRAILLHGGNYTVAMTLGFDWFKPSGYWKKWENFKKEADPVVAKFYAKHKRLPYASDLKKSNSAILNATNYFGGLNKSYARLGYLKEDFSFEDFIDFIEHSEVAKFILEKFGNDKSARADLIAVTSKIEKSKLSKYLDSPSLSEYLGNYIKGINSLKDLKEAEEMIPFDGNGIVENILKNAALNFMRQKLGVRPSKNDIKELESELITSLYQ